jgi:hypothetical protein
LEDKPEVNRERKTKMSNDVMNAHIKYGKPCGEDADVFQIADWAGSMLLDLHRWYEKVDPHDPDWDELERIFDL